MRTNSPISDPAPTALPIAPKVVKPPQTEWARFGKEKKYPKIEEYIEARKEYWRMYLPDGTPVQNVSKETRDQWWASAAQIISEYEDFQNKIAVEVLMSKQR